MPLLIVNCIYVCGVEWIGLPPESNYTHNEAHSGVTIELLLIARRLFMSLSIRLTHTNDCVSGTLRNWIFIGCSYGHAPLTSPLLLRSPGGGGTFTAHHKLRTLLY